MSLWGIAGGLKNQKIFEGIVPRDEKSHIDDRSYSEWRLGFKEEDYAHIHLVLDMVEGSLERSKDGTA
jgi:hypothetical protein